MSLLDSFESSPPSVQCHTLKSIGQLIEILDEDTLVKKVLPNINLVIQQNCDIRVQEQALQCLEKVVEYLPKNQIRDHVLPLLSRTQLEEPVVLLAVARIYQLMLSDKKHYGLTSDILATKIMPTMTPYIVSPYLSSKGFGTMSKLLQDMLDEITQEQCSWSESEKRNSLDQIVPLMITIDAPTSASGSTGKPRNGLSVSAKGQADLSERRGSSTSVSGHRRTSNDNVTKLMRAISSDSSCDENTDNTDANYKDSNSHLNVTDADINRRRHSDNSINFGRPVVSPANSRAPSPSLITRARSSSSLLNSSCRRRHSSVNAHEYQRIANKMLGSVVESVTKGVEKASQATRGIHSGLADTMASVSSSRTPSPSGSRRGSRRCSVAEFVSAAQSGSLFHKQERPKPKGPKKLFKRIGSEMVSGLE
ncbi:SCY1-like protein 2 [Halotydeus destructor]|nr:SCY1-like protein 2 [Halotydeus destructor]